MKKLLFITVLILVGHFATGQWSYYDKRSTTKTSDLIIDNPVILGQHTNTIKQLGFLAGYDNFFTLGSESKIVVYDLTGKVIDDFQENAGVKYCYRSPIGKSLIAIMDNGTVDLLGLNTTRSVAFTMDKFLKKGPEIVFARYNTQGDRIVTLSSQGIRIWDTLAKPIQDIALEQEYTAFDVSNDMRYFLAYGVKDGNAYIFNNQGSVLARLNDGNEIIKAAHFFANDMYVLTLNARNNLTIWDMDGKQIYSTTATRLEYNKQTQKYLLKSSNSLKLIDRYFKKSESLQTAYGSNITDATMFQDGSRYIVGYENKDLVIYNLEGLELARLLGHSGMIYEILVSKDQKKVIARSALNTYIWDVSKAVELTKETAVLSTELQTSSSALRIENIQVNNSKEPVTANPGQTIKISGMLAGLKEKNLNVEVLSVSISSKEEWLNSKTDLTIEEDASTANFEISVKVPDDITSKSIVFDVKIKNNNLTLFTSNLQKIKTIGISDIDINIPNRVSSSESIDPNKRENKYALIIGNENYQSGSSSINGTEVNVAYARNDAESFKKYAINVLGVPEGQVYLSIDVTLANIKTNVAKIAKFAELSEGKAEIFVFYSGHGLPHPETKKPMILPIDVQATNAELAYSIDEMIATIEKGNPSKLIAFIDACFSGVGKNGGNLLAQKGTRVKPDKSSVSGNTILISSSSDDEPSHIFEEQKHGFFTYHMLKLLQSSEVVTYKQLYDKLRIQLPKSVLKVKGANQTPTIAASPSLGTAWEQWNITD